MTLPDKYQRAIEQGDPATAVDRQPQLTVRKLPDAETMRRLYVEQRLSTYAIAEKYGAGHSTVERALERASIPRRQRQGGRGPGVVWLCGMASCGAYTGTQSGTLANAKKHVAHMSSVHGVTITVEDIFSLIERAAQ